MADERAVSERSGIALMILITIALYLTAGTFVEFLAPPEPLATYIVSIPGDVALLIGLNLGVLFFLFEIHEKLTVLIERTKPHDSKQSRLKSHETDSVKGEIDESELEEDADG